MSEVRPFLLGAKVRKQLNEVDGAFTKLPIRKIFSLGKELGIKKPVTFKLIENELLYLILKRRRCLLMELK